MIEKLWKGPETWITVLQYMAVHGNIYSSLSIQHKSLYGSCAELSYCWCIYSSIPKFRGRPFVATCSSIRCGHSCFKYKTNRARFEKSTIQSPLRPSTHRSTVD